MALPQDGQNANGLTKVTEIPKGKELIFIDPTTNEGGIITLEDLTTQILKNLTSQTFALDQGNMTLLAALNQLNSNLLRTVTAEIEDALPDDLPNGLKIASYTTDTKNSPSNYGVILYLPYFDGSNKWFTAIACSTNNGGIYISSKTNEASWSEWVKIQTQ